MAVIEVTAELETTGQKVTNTYDFGETLDDLIAKFTPEVVLSHSKRSFVISLQSLMRTQMKRGKTPEEITALVAEWKPGQKRVGKSSSERFHELMAKISPSERSQLLKEYRTREQKEKQQAQAQA